MANWDSRFEKWFYIIYVICTPKSLLSFISLSSKIQTKTRWNEFSSMYICILCVFLKKKKSNLMCFSTKLHSKEAKTSLSDTSHISYRKQKSLCFFFFFFTNDLVIYSSFTIHENYTQSNKLNYTHKNKIIIIKY